MVTISHVFLGREKEDIENGSNYAADYDIGESCSINQCLGGCAWSQNRFMLALVEN